MRPLVRSEQLRLRMPKEIKDMIKDKAQSLGMTVTAYVETLVVKDNKYELLTKKDIDHVNDREVKRAS